jgi:transcriptional regulator with XRE-family HTH domain
VASRVLRQLPLGFLRTKSTSPIRVAQIAADNLMADNTNREWFTSRGENMTRAFDDIDKKFGTAIRLARKKHKLTQMQLGEALRVTFQQIQKYEKGTNAVASTRIPALCRMLKTSPDDLFDLRGRSAQPTQISTWAAPSSQSAKQIGVTRVRQ